MDFIKALYVTKWYGLRLLPKLSDARNESRKKYAGHPILSEDDANSLIARAITDGTPFMAGRFGSCELNIMWRANEQRRKWDVTPVNAMKYLHENAGFFPNDTDAALKFAFEMKKATESVNLLGVWFNEMEDYELKKWSKDFQVCRIKSLEPFFCSKPWTTALEGKKVLVIHPFAETIKKQYEKRESLFPTPVLPEFELITQKAVQTIAGNKDDRFETWFDALGFMYDEAMKEDFDVAILGCGAYGFPLAARLKEQGKVVIHLGGATQVLFGIRGARWDERPEYQKIMTDAWVRPSENEVPKNAQKIENGCYW